MDFENIDKTFSTFRTDSEVSIFNQKHNSEENYSEMFLEIWKICEQAKILTEGSFDPWYNWKYDPLGVIKGWAADRAVGFLKEFGATSIQVNAAGDISLFGGYPTDKGLMPWKIGIQDPENRNQIVKVIEIHTGTKIGRAHV